MENDESDNSFSCMIALGPMTGTVGYIRSSKTRFMLWRYGALHSTAWQGPLTMQMGTLGLGTT